MEEELSSSGSDDEYQNEYAYSVDELSNSAVSVNVAGVAVNMLSRKEKYYFSFRLYVDSSFVGHIFLKCPIW